MLKLYTEREKSSTINGHLCIVSVTRSAVAVEIK